jgi:hypothetical protein
MTPAKTRGSATATVIDPTTRETSPFDRIGSSRPRASDEGRGLIINTVIVVALLVFVAFWWFGLR